MFNTMRQHPHIRKPKITDRRTFLSIVKCVLLRVPYVIMGLFLSEVLGIRKLIPVFDLCNYHDMYQLEADESITHTSILHAQKNPVQVQKDYVRVQKEFLRVQKESTLQKESVLQKAHVLQKEYPPGKNFELLPWEKLSLVNRTCKPPNGIPQSCCFAGTFSALPYIDIDPCLDIPMEVYDRARDVTHEFLRFHPVKENNCDICKIIDTLMKQNLNLAFLGDSVMFQTVNALQCELFRQGYHVSLVNTTIRVNGALVETAFSPYSDWNQSGTEKYGLMKVLNMTITRSNNELANNAQTGNMAKITYFNMYRPFLDNHEINHIAKNNDIVVFDHGLHWYPNEMYDYHFSMLQLLKGYKKTMKSNEKNKKLLAWRETSAQHFPTPTGDYHGGQWNFKSCFPINDGFIPNRPFRTAMMLDAAEMAGFHVVDGTKPYSEWGHHSHNRSELMLLPFYDLTKIIHYLHGNECTHYCHNPHMWQTIWRTLRLSIDRVYNS